MAAGTALKRTTRLMSLRSSTGSVVRASNSRVFWRAVRWASRTNWL